MANISYTIIPSPDKSDWTKKISDMLDEVSDLSMPLVTRNESTSPLTIDLDYISRRILTSLGIPRDFIQ
jgi:hypothetical protein